MAAAAEPWSGKGVEGSRGAGAAGARPGRALLPSPAVPCAWRHGARSLRSVARRSSSTAHVRPSCVCLWRTRLRAEHSAAGAQRGGAGGRDRGGGGGGEPRLPTPPRPRSRRRASASLPPGTPPAETGARPGLKEVVVSAHGAPRAPAPAGGLRDRGAGLRRGEERRREEGMPRPPLWLARQAMQRDPPAKCPARKGGPRRARAGPAPSPTPLHRWESRMRGGQSRRTTTPPPRRLRKGRGKGSEVTLLHCLSSKCGRERRLGGGRSRGRADPTEGGGRGAEPRGQASPRAAAGTGPGLPQPDPAQPECGGIGAGEAAFRSRVTERGSSDEPWWAPR